MLSRTYDKHELRGEGMGGAGSLKAFGVKASSHLEEPTYL